MGEDKPQEKEEKKEEKEKKEDKKEEKKEVEDKKKKDEKADDKEKRNLVATSTGGTPKGTKHADSEDIPACDLLLSPGRMKGRKRIPHDSVLKTERNEFKVERTLGTGEFGHVYKVSSLQNPSEVYALKTEFNEAKNRLLRYELNTLMQVNDEKNRFRDCFAKLIDRGKTANFKFIVMELLSHTLQDIFTVMCRREIPIPSAAFIAQSTSSAIDKLHYLGFIHRDIKPHNFAVGLGRNQCQIYIIGFGVSRTYLDEKRNIAPPKKKARFFGTLKYCSRRCHEQQDLMKRDDLESWVYMCLEFFNEGNINWDQMRTRNEIYQQKRSLFNKLDSKHLSCPVAFLEIMKEINNLKWEDGLWKGFRELMDEVCREAKLTDNTRLVWETEVMPKSRPRKKGVKNRVQNDDDSSERKKREEREEQREAKAKKKKVEEELLKVMREIDEGDGPADKKEEARRFLEERRRRSPNQKRRRRRRGPSVEDDDDEGDDDYDEEDDSNEDDIPRRKESHKRYRDEELKLRRQGSKKKPRSRMSQERTVEDKRGRKRSVKSKKSEKKKASRRKGASRADREEKLLKLEDSPPRAKGAGKKSVASAEKIDEDGERKETGKNKDGPAAGGGKEKMDSPSPSPAVTPMDGSDKGKKK